MRPSEVRQTILEDHEALRRSFRKLRDLLHAEGGDGPERDAHVRELGAALRQRFLRHLDLEDRFLVPALRGIDAWGPERAERVSREHAEQRERLERLLADLRDPARPVEALVAELDELVRDLLIDMEHEERAVLSEDLLRDDVISIDVETG